METPHPTGPSASNSNQLAVPVAIILAGAMIAGALYFVGKDNVPNRNANTPEIKNIPAVTADDHILGNPNADVIVVEYTDLECPFCKQFHATMKQVLAKYGAEGKVAWVVRNFPLSQLHPNAPRIALAAECVASIGGSEAYFKYLDTLFDAAPGNQPTDMSKLDDYAVTVGVSESAFTACVNADTHRARIEKQFNEAMEAGGQGTPFNIMITKDGEQTPLAGAQPYATVVSVIDTLLAK